MGKQGVKKLSYGLSLVLSIMLAFLTICGSYAGNFHPKESPTLAWIGLLLPGLLLANMLVFVLWLLKRKCYCILPLVAIAWNFEFILSVLHYSKEKQTMAHVLTVATYNIHSFNEDYTGYTTQKIAHFMKREQVDIICFQEYNWNKFLPKETIDRLFGLYPFHSAPTHNGKARIAVYSKYPILKQGFYPFKGTDNCVMFTDLQTPHKTIRIFNVHLQTTNFNASRHQIAKRKSFGAENSEIAKEITGSLQHNQTLRANQVNFVKREAKKSPYPTILCGDFNDLPSSYTYKHLMGDFTDGFREVGCGYEYTFKGLFHLFRIDYILHSPTLKCISYQSHKDLKYSDHHPVIARFQ
ncbi:MAG: endonuclease/exonuclease/phosphatase family protein [Bacteroidaceae bacterium]